MRVAVVGVGYLGKFHAQKYAQQDGVELVGICDEDKNQADKIAKNLNTTAFYDYQNLVSLVDAVSIVIPTKLHYQVAKFFLENKINVLVEKPITTTVVEAEELIKIAKKNNLVLQVGHLERFNPALMKANELLKKPTFIEVHRLAPFNPRGADVNVILDLMIHDIEIIQNLIKSKIKSIAPIGIPVLTKEVDICNARLEFANGCVANVSASRVSSKSERKMRFFQENMYIVVDFQEKTIAVYQNQSKDNVVPDQESISSEIITFDNTDAIMDETNAFINSVKNKTPPVVSGEDGKNALLTALQITEKLNS